MTTQIRVCEACVRHSGEGWPLGVDGKDTMPYYVQRPERYIYE